jgi:hypothetical protein
MSNIDTGGPAFPVPMFAVGHAKYEAQQQGLTMRDYFAAKAMQSFIGSETEGGMKYDQVAEVAYLYAAAMIKARNQS